MSLKTTLAEVNRRGLLGPRDDLADPVRIRALIEAELAAPQLRLFRDPASRLLACCGRRVGKNYTVSRLLIDTALGGPARRCFYVNGTRAEAVELMWDHPTNGVPAVLRHLGVRHVEHKSELKVTLDNGSAIRLLGADRDGFNRLLGTGPHLVVLDECQKTEGLRNAIEDVISFACADNRGRIVMIGVPNEYCHGYFHACATGGVMGWSVHNWDASQNELRPDIWERMLSDKALAGLADDDPTWLRNGRGLWIRSTRVMFLDVDGLGCLWDGTLPSTVPSRGGVPVPRSPDTRDGEMRFFAGVDTGTSPDPWAMTVGSWSREENVLREVHSEAHNELNTGQQAARMRWAMEVHGVRRFFVDAGAQGRQIAKDYVELHGLPVEAADKHDKATWQDQLIDDARAGRALVLRGSELHRECSALVYDQEAWDGGVRQTAPGLRDDLYHSWLYLYRGVRTSVDHTPEAPMTDAERDLQRALDLRTEALSGRTGRRRGPGPR